MRCLCIGPACIGSSGDYMKSSYCMQNCDVYPADRTVGLPPNPPDRDELILALHNFPHYKRVILREGGLLWMLPSRGVLTNPKQIVLLSIMTKPGIRLVPSRTFEAEVDDPVKILYKLEWFYRRHGIQFIKVDMQKLPTGNKYFRARMDKEKKKILVEIQA